jgi:2,4-dichlorophenol 6-monooxygenase
VDRANLSRDQFGPIFAALGIAGGGDDEGILAGLAACRAPDAAGKKRREALEAAIQLKNYEFNAHGVELNQRYVSGAVLDDGGPAEQWPRDPELFHQPSTRPGAKLPHAWLVDAAGQRVSTLDLVGHGTFTVVTGIAGLNWVEAAEKCAAEFGIALPVVRLGAQDARDAYGEWRRVGELDEEGALLVRPDGYIAFRQSTGLDSASALEKLRSALVSVLARAEK